MKENDYDFSGLKVLIIDDSIYMRQIIKILLHGMGFHKIFEAGDGTDALVLMKNNPFDIIFLDWEMPIMNGIEFIRVIRKSSEPYDHLIPIIMVSGHSELKRITEARDAGINEFVVKPLSVQTLYTRIVSVIEKPRPFIKTASFFGPDRRRKPPSNFSGTEQRAKMMEQLKSLASSSLPQDEIDKVMAQGEKKKT